MQTQLRCYWRFPVYRTDLLVLGMFAGSILDAFLPALRDVNRSAIRRVSVSDTSRLVVVDCEKPFEFFCPSEALPFFQAKLSSQLFHQAVSPFEAAKNALKDGTRPQWISAMAGQAVRLAEKEFEKEKRLRGKKPDDVA